MGGFWLISERENLRLFGRDWNNNDSTTDKRNAVAPQPKGRAAVPARCAARRIHYIYPKICHFRKDFEAAEHPTSNIQRRTSNRVRGNAHWELDVGCSALVVFLL